jgi:hypothetical protein
MSYFLLKRMSHVSRIVTRRNRPIMPPKRSMILWLPPIHDGPSGPSGPSGPYDSLYWRTAMVTGSASFIEAVFRKESTLLGPVKEGFDVVMATFLGGAMGLFAPVTFPAFLFYKAFWVPDPPNPNS